MPTLSPDDLHLRDVDYLFDLVVDLGRNSSECEMVIAIARQRKREDRDIVNGTGLDEGLACARRDQVEVGKHLLVKLDDALFLILPDSKPDDGHRKTRR